jgi:hypothetical protein
LLTKPGYCTALSPVQMRHGAIGTRLGWLFTEQK